MRAKYKVSLAIIGLMLAITLTLSTGYAVYISTNKAATKDSVTVDCFKAYFSNGQSIDMKNITSVLNEEGLETSPYTLTISNICTTEKELQVRLNVLKETTIDTNALTLDIKGDIQQETILYKNLKSVKQEDKNIVQSKLLGKLLIKPNETVRTNVKIWFDEKKAPTIPQDAIFKANFELIDTESSIKYNFVEGLLADTNGVDKKTKPDFMTPSVTSDGLYKTTYNNNAIYYYRGVVNNNYVKFGNYMWRIVSISDNNTIKLVLEKSAGNTKYANYSSTFDDAGFKFEYYYKMVDNNITIYLDNWYKTQIVDKGLDKYVVTSKFCNDASFEKDGSTYYFGAFTRTVDEYKPSLVCPDNTSGFGGVFERKIGLLTADEVIMAGGAYNTNNHNYYLYNGENFFTMSPSHHSNSKMNLFIVNNNGSLTTALTNSSLGVRPTINLDGTVFVSGNGTINNPYIIEQQ